MGNEQSKSKELTKNGKIPEKHENGSVTENGSVNGLSVNITSSGLEIDVNGETIVQQNGGPHSSKESTEPEIVLVETDSKQAEAPVISEIPEPITQKEEVKESGSSGDEAAAMIAAEHREDFENQKAEISTQTDRKIEADISTQTGDNDDTAANTEGPVEEAVLMETAANEEEFLNESAVVIAEEVVEDTAHEEPEDDHIAGIIIEDMVIMEDDMYENIVFRAERVEVIDNFEIQHIKIYDPVEESLNETELEVAAEPECNQNKSSVEVEIITEENNAEETAPLEIFSSLPKVVADCVEAVFAAASESTDFAAVNTSELRADDIITEDNGKGVSDMSADVVLIEIAEPESNPVVTPDAGKVNGVPSLDEEPVTTEMETILEVDDEEPYATPVKQRMSGEELPVPLVTEIQVEVESAHAEVTDDDGVAVPGICEKMIIMEAPSNELITIEELLEDTLNSDVIANLGPETVAEAEPSSVIAKDDAEVIPEAAIEVLAQEFQLCAIIHEPVAYNVIPVVEEVIVATTFVPLSGEQEANFTIPEEPSKTVAEEMNEEAIEALSNENEALLGSVEEGTTVEKTSTTGEVTEVASSEEPVEQKAEVSEEVLAQAESTETPEQISEISEEPVKENPNSCEVDATAEVLEDILESVVEAISEKLEVTENTVGEPADETAMDATGESKPCVSDQEELVEGNVAPSVVTVEEPTDSSPVISEEPVEETVSSPEPKVLAVILETTEDEVTDGTKHETDHSGDVLAAVDVNSKDSHIATSDGPVAAYVEAVLEAIVEEIIAEDGECNLATSEEVAPKIITEDETAESESSVNSTDSTQSVEMIDDTPVTSTDMEALLVRLHSACKSVVEESPYKLGGLTMSSLGYSITVTIQVAPKEEQQ